MNFLSFLGLTALGVCGHQFYIGNPQWPWFLFLAVAAAIIDAGISNERSR